MATESASPVRRPHSTQQDFASEVVGENIDERLIEARCAVRKVDSDIDHCFRRIIFVCSGFQAGDSGRGMTSLIASITAAITSAGLNGLPKILVMFNSSAIPVADNSICLPVTRKKGMCGSWDRTLRQRSTPDIRGISWSLTIAATEFGLERFPGKLAIGTDDRRESARFEFEGQHTSQARVVFGNQHHGYDYLT